MTTNDPRSKCCQSPVTVEEKTTHYYVCDNCGKPCDVTTNAKGMKPSEQIRELFKNKKYEASDRGYVDAIVDYLDEFSKYYINSRTVYWMGVEMGMKIAKSEKQHEAKGEV